MKRDHIVWTTESPLSLLVSHIQVDCPSGTMWMSLLLCLVEYYMFSVFVTYLWGSGCQTGSLPKIFPRCFSEAWVVWLVGILPDDRAVIRGVVWWKSVLWCCVAKCSLEEWVGCREHGDICCTPGLVMISILSGVSQSFLTISVWGEVMSGLFYR